MKKATIYLISVLIMAFTVSCQNTGKKDSGESGMDKESKVEAKLQAIKEKSNDLADKISNATYAERKTLQDDVEDFVSETKEALTEMETDSELENNVEEMIDNMEEGTYILVEEAKKFGDKTEDQWEETKSEMNAKMKKIGDEIDSYFSK